MTRRKNRKAGPSSDASAAARPPRLWELDALRGVAILGMISFHFLFDLKYFGIHPSVFWLRDLGEAFWDNYSTAVAVSFLALVGVSATLRSAAFGRAGLAVFRKPALRVLGASLLVTAISLLFNRELPIYFGILHCIGVSLLLLPVFLRLGNWNLPLAAGMIVVGKWLYHHPVSFVWLLPFGFKRHPMPMGDYFPLLPWAAIVALGAWLAQRLRLAARPHWFPERWGSARVVRGLSFLGRHSLLIYLIHQPILLAITSLIGLTRFPS